MDNDFSDVSAGYTDLGLPSGTLWGNCNASGFYTYDEAVSQFGNHVPTKAQWNELNAKCQWSWNENRYKVTGPNGNFIVLPAEGHRDVNGYVQFPGENGLYWSSTPDGPDYAWYFLFNSGGEASRSFNRSTGRSVRLVNE